MSRWEDEYGPSNNLDVLASEFRARLRRCDVVKAGGCLVFRVAYEPATCGAENVDANGSEVCDE